MLRVFQRSVLIAAHGRMMEGDLTVPEGTSGVVIFAHGRDGNRHSPLHRAVASALHPHGLATLRLDLLTLQEEMVERWGLDLGFDIDILASRLLTVRDWLLHDPEMQALPAGYFSSSLGTAAALVAAARQPAHIAAVVSLAGRPDLVPDVLPLVIAPTLFIVAGEDLEGLLLHQKALDGLRGEKALRLTPPVPQALLEVGTLDEAARMAGEWFSRAFHAVTRMRAQGWADEQGGQL